jgi:hypothetical protein
MWLLLSANGCFFFFFIFPAVRLVVYDAHSVEDGWVTTLIRGINLHTKIYELHNYGTYAAIKELLFTVCFFNHYIIDRKIFTDTTLCIINKYCTRNGVSVVNVALPDTIIFSHTSTPVREICSVFPSSLLLR